MVWGENFGRLPQTVAMVIDDILWWLFWMETCKFVWIFLEKKREKHVVRAFFKFCSRTQSMNIYKQIGDFYSTDVHFSWRVLSFELFFFKKIFSRRLEIYSNAIKQHFWYDIFTHQTKCVIVVILTRNQNPGPVEVLRN